MKATLERISNRCVPPLSRQVQGGQQSVALCARWRYEGVGPLYSHSHPIQWRLRPIHPRALAVRPLWAQVLWVEPHWNLQVFIHHPLSVCLLHCPSSTFSAPPTSHTLWRCLPLLLWLWQKSREKSHQNHLIAFEGVKIHIKWHYYLQSKREEEELWWHSPCCRSRLTFHLRPRENLHKILLLPLLQSATTYKEKSIRDCIHRYRQRAIDENLSEINSTTTVPNVTQRRRGI